MILMKAIGGGVIGVLLTWLVILVIDHWIRKGQATGLGAVAGGWTFLLQLPIVVLALSAAFGIGLYAVVRLSVR